MMEVGEFLRVEEIEVVFDLEYCAMMPHSKRYDGGRAKPDLCNAPEGVYGST
jgi:hypothetical protein